MGLVRRFVTNMRYQRDMARMRAEHAGDFPRRSRFR
jgi:hypothetical protein